MSSRKSTALLLAGLLLTPPVASADDEPGVFSRTLRGINEFFGASAAAQADIHTRSRFSNEEIAVIRDVLGRRGGVYRDDDYDDDYDDDDDGHGKYKNKKHKGKKHKDQRYDDDYADGGKKPKRLPPGLRKKLERGGELPPGWKKKFERGEVVSDEVWAQRHGLPDAVLRDINQIPGTEVIQVGDRVARVLTETREILDIIDLVTGP